MKLEDKELLLKDLCARLPYWVICKSNSYRNILFNSSDISLIESEEIKPYLRPMDSMTEEEVTEFESITEELLEHGASEEIWDTVIDWLNAHHFDHRHLIEKGLAIEAPEGMYNITK